MTQFHECVAGLPFESIEDCRVFTSTSLSPKFQMSWESDLFPLAAGKCSTMSLIALGPTVKNDSVDASGAPGAMREFGVDNKSR